MVRLRVGISPVAILILVPLGDDCITIGSGTTNVHASNGYCEGGHGLSIGSLGSGGSVAQVNNVYFENFVMVPIAISLEYTFTDNAFRKTLCMLPGSRAGQAEMV